MSGALQESSLPCAGLCLLPAGTCCVPATQERGGWLPRQASILASGITAEMYSSLSANKLELKVKIAVMPAVQVTSMGASPTCLLLAAARGVGVPWLACPCCLAGMVCHFFSLFKCLQTR